MQVVSVGRWAVGQKKRRTKKEEKNLVFFVFPPQKTLPIPLT